LPVRVPEAAVHVPDRPRGELVGELPAPAAVPAAVHGYRSVVGVRAVLAEVEVALRGHADGLVEDVAAVAEGEGGRHLAGADVDAVDLPEADGDERHHA